MENINIDFIPDRKLSDRQRLACVENYLGRLSDRVKFCFANVADELNTADSENRIRRLENLIYPALAGSSNGVTVENAVPTRRATRNCKRRLKRLRQSNLTVITADFRQ